MCIEDTLKSKKTKIADGGGRETRSLLAAATLHMLFPSVRYRALCGTPLLGGPAFPRVHTRSAEQIVLFGKEFYTLPLPA